MAEKEQIKVWDIGIRIFHWSLAILFFIAYFTGDDENRLHIYAGYGVLALVAYRIVWGFVGTKHARFTNFISGPVETFKYIKSIFSRKPHSHTGHNPLGGWMVFALLLSLIGTCWSGLEVYGQQGHGPLAQAENQLISSAMAGDDEETLQATLGAKEEESEGEEFWEEIHEAFSNFTLFLVFLHVAGVLMASAMHKENLIKTMITGYKPPKA